MLWKLERYDEALACYERAVDWDAADWHGWLGKAIALDRLDRGGEAGEVFDRALERFPGVREVWLAKVRFLDRHKQFEDALRAAEDTIGLDVRSWEA